MKLFVFILGLFCFCVCEGKVYEKCQLAKELLNVHKLPKNQIATWVCIAFRESTYNTKATHKNTDGSTDYGLFQINDRYWCGDSKKECKLSCKALLDDNIADDVRCAKLILQKQKFSAWSTYNKYCNRDTKKYIEGCGI